MSVTTEGATRRVTMSQVYVTGLACAMASVRQMSQVWHVSWRLCVRCHGVRASDVMSRNVKTAAVKLSDFHSLMRTPIHRFKTKYSQRFQSFTKQCFKSADLVRFV